MVNLNKKEKNNNKQVIKLQQAANISYEEAEYVLKKKDGDLLDALSFLEEKGRIKNSKVLYYNTKDYNPSSSSSEMPNSNNYNFSQKIPSGINDVLDRGSRNYFEIRRKNTEPIKVPLIAFIALTFTAFGFVVPLIIIGMFCDITYEFTGKDISENDSINIFLKKCNDTIQRWQGKIGG
ncbi:hypothetical protein ACTNDG_12225 [Clostridium sp. HCP1S3_B4]|uniref:hypothetical protein n=1 Tax=unclassified Clostridium TaxID=2614128 RepID=UPI0016AF8F80|nr:hypothetical protein [Clostridiales bacterium]MDY2728999.1 hypothetical protein [Clostridium sp.]NLK23132.1 hypothetical protein [Clostridiales bacterium]